MEDNYCALSSGAYISDFGIAFKDSLLDIWMNMLRNFLASFLCLIALNAQSSARTGPQSDSVQLAIPVIKQPYMRCLVASVSMVLKYWGTEISPDQIGEKIPVYGDGTAGEDLAKFVEGLGFHGLLIQPSFDDLIVHVRNGRPVIIALPARGAIRHAMVLAGFDLTAGTVSLNDPAAGKRITEGLALFRERWERGQRWTLLIVPKRHANEPSDRQRNGVEK
jgi:ABC-type bacteriocin/lantibiotic exporter with double-glycine peptidase domain